MNKLTSLELFSGAGGLALGLEAAGFENRGLVELNRDACATLRENRPKWNVLQEDIRKIAFQEFGNIDLIAGGPPCQPFSIGGKARGYDDTRDMFPQAVRAVHELQPKAFIFENVRGLMREKFSNYVEYIRLQLTYPDFPLVDGAPWDENLQRLQKHHNSQAREDGLTYQVSINVADAANYGVPQRRHRVFFVGIRSDINVPWFFPTPLTDTELLLRSKFVTGSYWEEHNITQIPLVPERLRKRVNAVRNWLVVPSRRRWNTVRDAIGDLPHPKDKHDIPNHKFQPGARSYKGHTGSPLDEPSKALKAGDHGVPGGENMLAYEIGKVRYFSVRESARIQTFPDDYIFSGSWTESMRQLGNAVPVNLAKAVASSVHRHLVAADVKQASIQSAG